MNTTHNPKFKRLYRRLGLGIAQTLGHLECLWQYTHSTANPVYKPDDVEASSEWEGESGILLAALLAEGWLDRREDGLVEVHDYWDNCPQTVRDRIKKREQRAGHVRDTAGHVQDSTGRGGQEKKRKEKKMNRKEEDPPLPPKGESASEQESLPIESQPKESDLDWCIRELPSVWNAAAPNGKPKPLPKVLALSAKRKQRIRTAWKESEVFRARWAEIPAALVQSEFHCGQNDRGWTADFDFMLQPGRPEQILERAAAKPKHGSWRQ